MFNKKDYPIGSNVCVHCSSKEEASDLFELLNEHGYTWASREILNPDRTRYGEKDGTCYSLTDIDGVMYGSMYWFIENKWKIIEASDILDSDNNIDGRECLLNFLCSLKSE